MPKAKTKTVELIEITRQDDTTFTIPFDKKKWRYYKDFRSLRASNYKSARVVYKEVKVETKKSKQGGRVFHFSNGMSVEYKGKRTNVTGAYIAVYQGEIMYKGFSSQGKDGARKASEQRYHSQYKFFYA